MAAASPTRTTPTERTARPLRLLLMVLAGVATLLCLGGVGVGINLYDEATAVKRDEPDIVVANYLGAQLVERDDATAKLYSCAQDRGLEPVRALKRDIEMREQSFDVSILVDWGALSVQPAGEDRLVTTDIGRSLAGGERSVQVWRFTVVDENGGWRVCSAERAS
ncbi:hypothetical protein [Asanoa iriomotensis]|uniref:Mce-associated membrane protein n=1 Tax=Asanoa iriomotensis TaxID=234613 RepID=A0ABQ4C6P3_9ACTN|nr:hypothetical protein [Asanoa iriomotensis]GIF58106.1 hypothetical protein Air01nite_42010 [Asanoa iriomotensis]